VHWLHKRIPELEEVLDTVPQDKKLFVEIKAANGILGEIETIQNRLHLSPDQVILMDSGVYCITSNCAHWLRENIMSQQ